MNINNILDLTLTNRSHYIADVESNPPRLSDHNLASVSLAHDDRKGGQIGQTPKICESGTFYDLDLNKANMEAINLELDQVDWNVLKHSCPTDDGGTEFAEKIHSKVLEVCAKNTPKKVNHQATQPKSSRNRRILNRKRRKLNVRLKCLKLNSSDSTKIEKIEEELNILAVRTRDVIEDELSSK